MDLKDRRIIYSLDGDSRKTFVQIGKEVRLSPETVRYRMNRLVEKGIISNFITIINTHLFGYAYYELFLRLKKVDAGKRRAVIDFLCADGSVCWVGECDGSFDIGFILAVRHQHEMGLLLDRMQERFGPIILRKTVSVNLQGEFLSREYLLGRRRGGIREPSYTLKPREMELDGTDAVICRCLSRDARIPAIDIAREAGLSADAVILRMRRMRERGVVVAHSIVLDNARIGQIHFKMLLYLSDSSPEVVKDILGFVRLNERVIAIVKSIAEWDYEIDLEVEDLEQFKGFTMELVDRFADAIRDYDVLRIMGMKKYGFFPEG